MTIVAGFLFFFGMVRFLYTGIAEQTREDRWESFTTIAIFFLASIAASLLPVGE